MQMKYVGCLLLGIAGNVYLTLLLVNNAGRESEWTAEELEEAAEALGYGAIK